MHESLNGWENESDCLLILWQSQINDIVAARDHLYWQQCVGCHALIDSVTLKARGMGWWGHYD